MTDAELYDRILATITEQLAEQGLPDANPMPIADGVWEVLGHGFSDEVPHFEREPADGPREALLDAAMLVEAMTWGRTFPNEPTPTTRDLVVFAATAGYVKRRLRSIAEESAAALATPDTEAKP